jgi:hypothetical protein
VWVDLLSIHIQIQQQCVLNYRTVCDQINSTVVYGRASMHIYWIRSIAGTDEMVTIQENRRFDFLVFFASFV